MKQYYDLLRKILDTGNSANDRTGVGTSSLFGEQIKFNLQHGFPLLTGKFTSFKAISNELLWFLNGYTNNEELRKLNSNDKPTIWEEWATEDGDLSNIYGAQWKRWYLGSPSNKIIEVKIPDQGIDEHPHNMDVNRVDTFGNESPDDYVGMTLTTKNGEQATVVRRTKITSNSYYLIQYENGHLHEISRPNLKNCLPNSPDKRYTHNGIFGNPQGYDKTNHTHFKLYTMWDNMMRRCHDTNHKSYDLYGGKGVYVTRDWRIFANFFQDINQVIGYSCWVQQPSEFDLDKDYTGSNYYSKHTCVFVPTSYNIALGKSSITNDVGYKWTLTNLETNISYEDIFVTHLLDDHGIKVDSNYFKTYNNQYKNWYLEKTYPRYGYVFRHQLYIDQIDNLIKGLKERPFSRRHIISAWNVADLPDESLSPQENVQQGKMALAPCHAFVQFGVREIPFSERAILYVQKHLGVHYGLGYDRDYEHLMDNVGVPRYALSCHLYQRSADIFLGVPYNIASYALLIEIIGNITNMLPDQLVISFGDVHLYNNHVKQAKELLSRNLAEYGIPSLVFKDHYDSIDEINEYSYDLMGYRSHGTIKAEVAV